MASPEVAYEVSIVNVTADRCCVPYPVELIKKKCHGLFNAHFEGLDASASLFLQVDDCSMNCQKKRITGVMLLFSIFSQCMKRSRPLQMKTRLDVFLLSNNNDLLFAVQRSRPLQMKTRLDVFLLSNNNEDISNFKVVGSYSSQSCEVHKGNTVIAEVTFGN